MIEIKFLGRGGQGVVIASEILARACFEEGLYPQSFSIFGGERRGATVAAFVRVDREKIYLKCDIDRPDHLVIFDTAVITEMEIKEQVSPGGVLLLNSGTSFPPDQLRDYRVACVHALEISKKRGLGTIVNTAMLGAYVRLSQIVNMETLLKVIRQTVPAAVEENLAAAREAYETLLLG
jgi:2-oxoacid:acceptor oxidoreductase gamma subunit (pyruvate/2-ketoisovalerate family)